MPLDRQLMDNDDFLPRLEQVEARVKALNDALLGTLDGRPGIRAKLDEVALATHHNSVLMERLTSQLDALRLDKAKVAGIVIATGTIVGVGLKLLHF